MINSEQIVQILKENKDYFEKVIDVKLNEKNTHVLDLSINNNDLYNINLADTQEFSNYLFEELKKEKKKIGVGGYLENRLIYKRSRHFDNENEDRTIHLGIDIWTDLGTDIFSPLPGVVHSFKFNDTFGDYGATLILEHLLEGKTFYTLYGHLSLDSITNKETGQQIRKGDVIASVGNEKENGGWPPHLHFQLMVDMLGNEGDFPGVASKSEKEYYQQICINPNLILNIESLK